MKKILSLMLAVAMVISMCATVSAQTIAEGTSYVPNPMALPLTLEVSARATGTGEYEAGPLDITVKNNAAQAMDYKTTLDMSAVRALFDEGFIAVVLENDQEALDEFNAAIVTTQIDVTITRPENATIRLGVDLNSADAGVLDAGSIFSEASRVYDGNTLTISYVNEDNLTAQELKANKDEYLKDITFTLANAISFNQTGTEEVNVSLSGSTTIAFATKTQVVNYTGEDSHTTNVTRINTGSPINKDDKEETESFVIKVNTNGAGEVEDITVEEGKKVELPELSKEGFEFAGWYTDEECTEEFDVNAEITKDLTLYVKWEKIGDGHDCPSLPYKDLDTTLWYHEGVDYALINKLMIGVAEAEFAPNLDVTRAMLVTVLYRIEGEPEVEAEETFEDIESGSYYEKAVIWGEQNGIILGYSDTEFAPNQNIIREQFAAIMYRYAQFKGYDVSVGENTNILSYDDAEQISEYAIPAMQYAVGSGLITGRSESTLNPKDNTTRAEMATILYRFLADK